MVERAILLTAAILVGLLFIYAVMIAPPPPGEHDPSLILNALPNDPPDHEWFSETVLDEDGLVIVDFNASWCGPCRKLRPHLVKYEEEHAGKVKLVEIDVDDPEMRDLAIHYEASSIPFVLMFNQGQVVSGFRGYRTYKELEKIAEPHLLAL